MTVVLVGQERSLSYIAPEPVLWHVLFSEFVGPGSWWPEATVCRMMHKNNGFSKVRGRNRHLAVDTRNLQLTVVVTVANMGDT